MGTKKLIEIDKPSVISAWAYLMGIWIVYKLKQHDFHIKYADEIAEWKKYKDQKLFEKLIGKIIRSEMDKFHVTPEEIESVVNKIIKEPEWEITIVKNIGE